MTQLNKLSSPKSSWLEALDFDECYWKISSVIANVDLFLPILPTLKLKDISSLDQEILQSVRTGMCLLINFIISSSAITWKLAQGSRPHVRKSLKQFSSSSIYLRLSTSRSEISVFLNSSSKAWNETWNSLQFPSSRTKLSGAEAKFRSDWCPRSYPKFFFVPLRLKSNLIALRKRLFRPLKSISSPCGKILIGAT